MTVIVGILCSDGVVIGSDSALAVGRVGRYTIERQEGNVFKIEIIEGNIITAFTGAAGLAQRFNDQLAITIKELRQPYVQPRLPVGIGPVGTPVQLALFSKGLVPTGKVPYDEIGPVEIGRIVSQLTIDDFRKTPSILQQQPTIGWGFGALFAFVCRDEPHLLDFDTVSFHPELKGLPDEKREGRDRIWRCVSMGAGQAMADAFLAHSYRLLFGQQIPTINRAKLVVAWTINHVVRYNPGLVGGELQLAVLEKRNGAWEARYEDAGETQQQVAALEKYVSQFVEQQKPDAAAEASKIDVNKVLSGEQQLPEPSPTPDITAGSDAPRFAAKQAKPAGEPEIPPWETHLIQLDDFLFDQWRLSWARLPAALQRPARARLWRSIDLPLHFGSALRHRD